MSLEDLGNIGEFVGAVAVVISLIYLAVQIRQNTTQMRLNTLAVGSASYQQVTEPAWRGVMEVAKDPDLARIMRAGYRDFEGLNDDERMRFIALMYNFMAVFEYAMRLREHDLVDADVFEALLDTNERLFQHPGVQRYMLSRKGALPARFRELVRRRFGVFTDEDDA